MFKSAIPVLRVKGASPAEEFYCRRLGFSLRSAYRSDDAVPDPCYMVLTREGAMLHVSSFPGDGTPGSVVFLPVEDLDALHAELVGRGVRIDTGPVDQTWGNREMYVKDPDGNSIRFIQSGG